jgi:hypothetical protein
MFLIKSKTPPFRTGLEKGNNSISASILTLPGGAFKGGGKMYSN